MKSDPLPARGKRSITEWLARTALQMFGWTLVTNLPTNNKYIIIAAPHTSVWDYPLTFLYALCVRVRSHWIGHPRFFTWPLRYITCALGGIKLDQQGKDRGFVEKLVKEFNSRERFVLGMTPEGTSAFVPRWRTGFYHVALGAQVPIVFAFVDYKSRSLGTGDFFMPSGDAKHDEQIIRSFYSNIEGKHPERVGPIKL